MSIGFHILEGKLLTLPKDILVTEDVVEFSVDGKKQVRLHVIGTAHKKILFDSRPKLRT